MSFDPTEHPHRRYNPLSGEWVLVSPHRAKRPWQGQQDEPDRRLLPAHDPDCFLCAALLNKSELADRMAPSATPVIRS